MVHVWSTLGRKRDDFRARSGVLEPTLEIDDALAVVVGEQVPIGVDHVFFFNTFTGRLLGTWKLPRAQSAVENCTIHNYNVVPTDDRDVLVMGNYQAGTWVVNFTNPRRARTIAWSDPPPLDPQNLTLGGRGEATGTTTPSTRRTSPRG